MDKVKQLELDICDRTLDSPEDTKRFADLRVSAITTNRSEWKDELRRQPSHLIDIMATCIDIANLEYPKEYNGHEIPPCEGKRLAPAFENKPVEHDYIIWEHKGNRAIRIGNWKLVSKVKKLKQFTPDDENAWELYDMENDRSGTVNLAEKYPEKVKEMASLWEKEALRTRIKPWPWQKEN